MRRHIRQGVHKGGQGLKGQAARRDSRVPDGGPPKGRFPKGKYGAGIRRNKGTVEGHKKCQAGGFDCNILRRPAAGAGYHRESLRPYAGKTQAKGSAAKKCR